MCFYVIGRQSKAPEPALGILLMGKTEARAVIAKEPLMKKRKDLI